MGPCSDRGKRRSSYFHPSPSGRNPFSGSHGNERISTLAHPLAARPTDDWPDTKNTRNPQLKIRFRVCTMRRKAEQLVCFFVFVSFLLFVFSLGARLFYPLGHSELSLPRAQLRLMGKDNFPEAFHFAVSRESRAHWIPFDLFFFFVFVSSSSSFSSSASSSPSSSSSSSFLFFLSFVSFLM